MLQEVQVEELTIPSAGDHGALMALDDTNQSVIPESEQSDPPFSSLNGLEKYSGRQRAGHWVWFCHRCGGGPYGTANNAACPATDCQHAKCDKCRREFIEHR